MEHEATPTEGSETKLQCEEQQEHIYTSNSQNNNENNHNYSIHNKNHPILQEKKKCLHPQSTNQRTSRKKLSTMSRGTFTISVFLNPNSAVSSEISLTSWSIISVSVELRPSRWCFSAPTGQKSPTETENHPSSSHKGCVWLCLFTSLTKIASKLITHPKLWPKSCPTCGAPWWNIFNYLLKKLLGKHKQTLVLKRRKFHSDTWWKIEKLSERQISCYLSLAYSLEVGGVS